MLLSIIVYGTMLLITTYCGYKLACSGGDISTFRSFCTNRYVFCIIFVFCLIASLRWRVGMDCNTYIRTFYVVHKPVELGFETVISFVKSIGGSHVLYLFILAFFEFFFFYYAFKCNSSFFIFIPFVLFNSGEWMMMMNGIRQSIACCIFVCATTQIVNRKYISCILLVLLGYLFHKSAIVLLPLLLFLFYTNKNYVLNKYVQYALIIGSFLVASVDFMEHINPYIAPVMKMIGYDESRMNSAVFTDTRRLGPRAIVDLLMYLVVVFFSSDLKNQYSKNTYMAKTLNIQYLLFLIGVCGDFLFFHVHSMVRLFMYFSIFKDVLFIYTLHYLFFNETLTCKIYYGRKLMVLLLIVMMIGSFAADSAAPKEVVFYKFYFNNM